VIGGTARNRVSQALAGANARVAALTQIHTTEAAHAGA